MAEQTEKAYLKQPKVFLSSKKTGKGKRPGKGGNRFCKNIGLGFKTPREAVEGTYIDKKCQFTGTLSVRGRILAGTSHSTKMMRTIIVRRNYLHWVKKYQRYEKRHSNNPAHVSPCFRVKEGDHVISNWKRFYKMAEFEVQSCGWRWILRAKVLKAMFGRSTLIKSSHVRTNLQLFVSISGNKMKKIIHLIKLSPLFGVESITTYCKISAWE